MVSLTRYSFSESSQIKPKAVSKIAQASSGSQSCGTVESSPNEVESDVESARGFYTEVLEILMALTNTMNDVLNRSCMDQDEVVVGSNLEVS